MKKICIVGQFPPPVHGLSAALQTILDSEHMNRKYEIKSIDIKENKKILKHLWEISKNNSDLYYFTISQSIFGNLRDMAILKILLNKNKKVIIHYHGGYYKELYNKMSGFQKRINKILLSKINIMIALGESLRNLFVDVIDISKVKVCENYVEDSSLIEDNLYDKKVASVREKVNLEVLYLSNFIKTKGYMDVLEAAKHFKNEKILFHFAGTFFSKQDEDEFLKFVEQNELQNVVNYHGVVRGEQKKSILMTSDVFVLPTYYPNEGQPISIIEAMGNGLTIITTNHAGIPDIVNSNNGYIIKSKSPEEIVDSLNELLLNREMLINFSNINRNLALNKFKEIHYIRRLEKIFDEVLSQ
ncbi:glycosyltransferase family 4 protein [Metabacillus indicus]|uniref:glycosyltransferase family 4 protein n=1 Tax=Metabacillus indicus TaxID=246786 RepID=UPI00317549DA